MSTRRRSIHGSASTTTKPLVAAGNEVASRLSHGDDLEAMRTKLVQERKEELDRVFDRHDTLVRVATVRVSNRAHVDSP